MQLYVLAIAVNEQNIIYLQQNLLPYRDILDVSMVKIKLIMVQ